MSADAVPPRRMDVLRDDGDADRRILARTMHLMEARGLRAAEAYRLARIEAGEIEA